MKHKLLLLLFGILAISEVYSQAQYVTNLQNAGVGSLRQRVNIASAGDTILFQDSLLTGVHDTLYLDTAIALDKGLYIKGLDHDTARLYLSGQNLSRIFSVNISGLGSSKTLTLKNLYMTNAKAITGFGHGGAIRIHDADTLRMVNCEIENCQATGRAGGLYSISYSITDPKPRYTELKGTLFKNNSGTNYGNIYFYFSGEVMIDGCRFEGFTQRANFFEFCDGLYIWNSIVRNNGSPALTDDSRIFLVDQADSMYVNNMVAYNNHSSFRSPVLWIDYVTKVQVENSTFYNNHANDRGGVVYCPDSKLNMKNCSFYNNSASWGGVVSANQSNFEQCIFKNNSALSKGGVLFEINAQSCRFFECELDSNSSAGTGGAVDISQADFIFEKSSATNNHSGDLGGAFNIKGWNADVTIKNSTISGNTADEGGAIAVTNQPVQILNSTIANNYATNGGGFVYFTWTDSLNLEGSVIVNNKPDAIKYYSSLATPIDLRSTGYNVVQFDDQNLLNTDLPNIDSTYTVLEPLAQNGGIGKTHLPLQGSLLVNRGNPFDFSLPQNDSIYAGRRDIGAAERQDSSLVYALSTTICDSIFIGGSWHYQVGLVTDTTQNNQGIDSITFVWITAVNQEFRDTQLVISCQPFTWVDGVTYQNSTDTSQFLFTSAKGCDSLVTLDYTRLNVSYMDTQFVSSCWPFMWIDSIQYTGDSDTTFVTLQSNKLCDSVVYLSFDRIEIDTSVSRNGATFIANDSNATYQWFDCVTGYFVPNGTNQSYTATSNGTYAVAVSKHGCIDTSACIEINNIGIINSTNLGFQVYPNPTNGKVTMTNTNGLELRISIINAEGAQVYQSTIPAHSKQEINLTGPSGVYFLKVQTDLAVNTVKIVKN